MLYKELWGYDETWVKNYPCLAGVDEVGRGPLAGNVVAACVILDLEKPIEGIQDSKKIKEAKREELFEIIQKEAFFVGVGQCSPKEIDRLNILQATFLAMKRAIQSVEQKGGKPDMILVDGNHRIPELLHQQECLIKGDGRSASIAAASIIAKVTRDRQMRELDKEYPEYGFCDHKGYGSKRHIAALLEHGFIPQHRRSFKPKALIQTELFT